MVLASMARDIASIKDRDPAARGSIEVLVTYSGLHALWGHRISNWLWRHKVRFAARVIAAVTRVLTNVDIHPGATIGEGLFIDHAIGVVIGETAEIGSEVTIYQGVTLGGTSLEHGKRHPTIGDRVVIGAGAKILGPVTIGDDSRIGANSVVVRSVPPNSVVVGVPGQVIAKNQSMAEAPALDAENAFSPDLVGVSLSALFDRVGELERQLDVPAPLQRVSRSTEGVWSGEDFSI